MLVQSRISTERRDDMALVDGDRAYEDFPVGASVVTAGRTIEIADILAFAGLTGDHYPLHTDEEFAKQTPFGTRIAHGPLTYAMAMGLVALSGFYGHAIIAMKECQSMRARRPVKPGDTLHVEASVTSADDGRRADSGTLTVHYDVLNQTGDTVMTFDMVLLARKRTPAFAGDGENR